MDPTRGWEKRGPQRAKNGPCSSKGSRQGLGWAGTESWDSQRGQSWLRSGGHWEAGRKIVFQGTRRTRACLHLSLSHMSNVAC